MAEVPLGFDDVDSTSIAVENREYQKGSGLGEYSSKSLPSAS
jgi:hypothetical protein